MNNKLKFITATLMILLISSNVLYAQDYNHKTAPVSQFLPKFSASYCLDDNIKIEDYIAPSILQEACKLPHFEFRSGLEYIFRGSLSAYYDCQFFCRYAAQHVSFSPEEGVFKVGISYHINRKIKITISHACYHPLESAGKYNNHNRIFGGYIKVTLISYGY